MADKPICPPNPNRKDCACCTFVWDAPPHLFPESTFDGCRLTGKSFTPTTEEIVYGWIEFCKTYKPVPLKNSEIQLFNRMIVAVPSIDDVEWGKEVCDAHNPRL